MPETSPSVLVIRLDAIGDAVALAPLIAAFHARAIPADLVLTPVNAGVFSSRAVRQIFTAPFALRSTQRSDRRGIERLGAQLAKNRYTHALVATEDPSGYRLALASGAAVRVGFSNQWGKPLKTLWLRRFLTSTIYRSAGLDRRRRHECEVLFQLGRPLFPETAPTRDVTELRPLLLEREPAADDRIAVQITDKWDRLGIACERVVETVRRLTTFGALRLFAAQRETEYADRIAAASGVEVERFASIPPWAAAIAASPALVTPDSGALHVAGMVGTPVVAVFPPGADFALQVARWSPWAAPHRIVRAAGDWPQRAADALAALLSI